MIFLFVINIKKEKSLVFYYVNVTRCHPRPVLTPVKTYKPRDAPELPDIIMLPVKVVACVGLVVLGLSTKRSFSSNDPVTRSEPVNVAEPWTDSEPVITVLPLISKEPLIAPVDFPIATCEPVIQIFGVAVAFENKYND